MTPWFYIIAGFCMVMYPLSVVVRCREWETKQRLAGKSLLLGYLYIPILMVMSLLGMMMLVLGAEVLKGTIPITL